MERRILSVDALRGLSIIGMVFCASIAWNSGLPAWMFHCQVPPPDYAFHPEVRGITWVDLVFPFFLFALGAALPFAIRSKMDRNMGVGNILMLQFRRFAVLVFFAMAIGNSYSVASADAPQVLKWLFMPLMWTAFFLSLWRCPRPWTNVCGWLMIGALMLAKHFYFGIPLDWKDNDVIIMILAFCALGGALLYMASAGRAWIRWALLALLVAIKASGIFDLWYFQYLIIVLPASIMGDLLYQKRGSSRQPQISIASICILVMAVTVQLWGLYSRKVMADWGITAALCIIYTLMNYRRRNNCNIMAYTGFALLLCGIAFDPLDGGIAKDYCNLSYLLVSGGMASISLAAISGLEHKGWGFPLLSRCGQNPMIAYTVSSFVILPVLNACGAMELMGGLTSGNIFWGIMQGVILTALMCCCTVFFTNRKIFWRS